MKSVYGSVVYVDWLPFDRETRPRANAFLSRGSPFGDLEKPSGCVARTTGAGSDSNGNYCVHRARLAPWDLTADLTVTLERTAREPQTLMNPEALWRTRTADPLLTMEVLYQLS